MYDIAVEAGWFVPARSGRGGRAPIRPVDLNLAFVSEHGRAAHATFADRIFERPQRGQIRKAQGEALGSRRINYEP